MLICSLEQIFFQGRATYPDVKLMLDLTIIRLSVTLWSLKSETASVMFVFYLRKVSQLTISSHLMVIPVRLKANVNLELLPYFSLVLYKIITGI
jgi:hypothetical protein